MGRFCNPDEIYNTVRYLIETEYVTKAEFNQALAQLESMIMVPKDQEKKSTALVF